MGQIWPRITKKYYRFNAENRAFRYLEQNKYVSSPKHPSTIKYIDNLMTDEKTMENLMMKNEKLDENLKQIYVKSFDPPVQPSNKFGKPSEMRKLPVNRSTNANAFSYLEPDHVPEGKLSLRQAMQLITAHQQDPQKFTATSLSQQYKLPISDIENILTYFSNFKILVPKSQKLKQQEKPTIFSVSKKVLSLMESKKEDQQK